MVRRALLSLLTGLVLAGGLGAQTPAPYYWDDPVYLVRSGARYPTAVDNGKMAAAFWQERRTPAGGWAQTYLSLMVRRQGDPEWTTRKAVLGPFTLIGSEAQIYSALLTPQGEFWVAVLGDDGQVLLYRSADEGASFQLDGRLSAPGTLLVPKLFLGEGDQPLLVVNQADANTFRLAVSRRSGGRWTPLEVVTPEAEQRQSFSASVVRFGKTLTLVYQSLFTAAATETTTSRITYQIYRKDSADGGATWGPAVRISDFADDLGENPGLVDNQRPAAYSFGDRLFVSWERRTVQTQPVIELVSFNAQGRRLDNQALTSPNFTARTPLFYTFRNQLRLAWFDNRNETYDLYLSAWDPALGWDTPERLTQETGNSIFGQPAHLGDDLYFFWQNNFGDNPGLVMIGPDRRAEPPSLAAVGFKAGVKRNKPDFSVQVDYPRDISGIRGFNVLLTQDEKAEPDRDRLLTSKDRLQSVRVPAEGRWYLAASVQDNAGNWSPASRIPLDLKTTPPGPVAFAPDRTDARGFLDSNTFQLSWKPTTDDAVAYSWRIERIGDALTPALLASLKGPEPSASPLGTGTSAGGDNFEDGLWALAVTAFDEAGNRGPVATHFFRLNKFRPYTLIQFVETQQDAFGRVQIAIHGRGFSAGGAIDHVYIDRDGQAPFDYDLGPSSFRIASDRLVDGIKVEGLAEGIYRIGVGHPDRGRLFTGPVLKVEPTGTVKIGDYRNLDRTVWEFFQGVTLFFSVHALAFWAVMVLLALGALGSLRLLLLTWAERLRIDRQAAFLFADTTDKWARRAGRELVKTKRQSLAFKFAASILGLMLAVILMLAGTLGFFITGNSQVTLGTALQQRTQVLLDSLATGARTYLPIGNIAGLGDLPAQISAMEGEALYATITGPSGELEKKAGHSFVYASNDPDRLKKIDTPTLLPGTSVLKDEVEPLWEKLQADLNQKAEEAVGDLTRQVQALTDQEQPLRDKLTGGKAGAKPQPLSPEEKLQLTQMDDQVSKLKIQIGLKLVEVGGKARTLPDFDLQNLLGAPTKRYLFYQPYLYYIPGDPTYVRGLVRIEVSSEKIEKQIIASRDQLILVTVIVALLALGLGLVGAFLLSALTINPIRKLVSGVAKIRDTQDKTQLAGHLIDVKTRDELEDLAATVNQMTRGLVDGASRTQDLTKGKVEQKTLFIPLDKDADNQKKTTYHQDLEDIEVFAYYEGAKLVSGDLYEFRQLDTRDGKNPRSPWYGIMKGDVSGKGVEAGMIMAIAAMFVTTFFRRWSEAKDARDTKVDSLLFQINDTIEPILAEAGRGLFVALNVGILNAKTGALRFSQAGDNLLHIWRGRTETFESVDLEKTISVGAMPSSEHRFKYRNRDLRLESGDTLLYFTDGVEESQSAYRDARWNPVAYFDPQDPSTLTAPNSERMVPVFEGGPVRGQKAENTEDFNPHRIEAVITAYYQRQVYELVKRNWVHPEHTFHFDFRSCDGSARGLVTALISIDRIFRLVPDPAATADDYIDLDLEQDAFLKKHFVEYDRYFKNGYQTYEQGGDEKSIVDAEGYRLKGTQRVPLWQKGAPGETVDAEGYRIVDDERVPQWEKGDPKKGDTVDAEGYKLAGGRRVPAFERGNPKKGDLVDAEGYKLVGGTRILRDPGYIRYGRLKEDHQFDDLTLLAIRKK